MELLAGGPRCCCSKAYQKEHTGPRKAQLAPFAFSWSTDRVNERDVLAVRSSRPAHSTSDYSPNVPHEKSTHARADANVDLDTKHCVLHEWQMKPAMGYFTYKPSDGKYYIVIAVINVIAFAALSRPEAARLLDQYRFIRCCFSRDLLLICLSSARAEWHSHSSPLHLRIREQMSGEFVTRASTGQRRGDHKIVNASPHLLARKQANHIWSTVALVL